MTSADSKRVVHQFPAPVRRNRIAAWVRAWWAVRCGVGIDDFLRACLARDQLVAPQDASSLPYGLEVVEGRVERVPLDPEIDPRIRALDDPAGVPEPGDAAGLAASLRAVRALNRARGETLAREIGERQDDADLLTAQLAELRERLSRAKLEQQEAVAVGEASTEATRKRDAEQRGRVPAPSVAPRALAWLCALVLIVSEGFQFFTPVADWSGVDVSDLARAWSEQRTAFVLCLLFALGVAAASVWLVELSVFALRRAFDAGPALRRIVAALGVLASAGAYALLGLAITRIRHGGAVGQRMLEDALAGSADAATGIPEWAVLVVTLAVPIAASCFLRVALLLGRRASEVERQQREWDQSENERLERVERDAELVRAITAEAAALEPRVDAAQRELRRLGEIAAETEANLRREIEAGRRYAVAWLLAVEAGLALDELFFRGHAARCGRGDLLAPSGEARAWTGPAGSTLRWQGALR